MTKVNVGDTEVGAEPSHQYSIPCCCERQMAAEGQSDTMVSGMEVQMKQRCVTEFLHTEKNRTH